MTKNFKLTIEYDGTKFSGWQRQKEKFTIQEEIEIVLSKILNQKIIIHGSSRTDAGVHAFEQVANFHANTDINPVNLKKAVNSLNKKTIVIKNCCIVDDNFHAVFNTVSKEYHYYILNQYTPCAIKRQYQWHIRHALDIKAMNQCCELIIGSFDFKSFENKGSPRSSTIREIFFAKIQPQNKDQDQDKDNDRNRNILVFKICANGFLKNMVRNIIGTLVPAGLGKLSVDQFKKILDNKDRTQAGATAPPHGLFLNKINYS